MPKSEIQPVNEAHRKLLARLAELRALKPSGEYYVRERRIDDHNPYWRAGWPIPDLCREQWEAQRTRHLQWVIADTGTDLPVLSASPELIMETWAVYQKYPEKGIILYDPDDYSDDYPDEAPRRQHHKPHHSYRHQRSA